MKASILLLCSSLLVLVGCGKYGPPVPPELLAPAAVGQLEVRGRADGVALKWQAPDKDLRREEVKDIGAYMIERAEVLKFDPLDPFATPELADDFAEVTVIEDKSIEARERIRAEAREAGKPWRRLNAPGELRSFEFLDKGVVPGKSYVYRIVPLTSDGIEGGIENTVRVVFNGEASEVTVTDAGAFTRSAFE